MMALINIATILETLALATFAAATAFIEPTLAAFSSSFAVRTADPRTAAKVAAAD
jgi:hypothetical protein